MNDSGDFIKKYKKMTPEGLKGLEYMRKRAFVQKAKKGKGSYERNPKHKTPYDEDHSL